MTDNKFTFIIIFLLFYVFLSLFVVIKVMKELFCYFARSTFVKDNIHFLFVLTGCFYRCLFFHLIILVLIKLTLITDQSPTATPTRRRSPRAGRVSMSHCLSPMGLQSGKVLGFQRSLRSGHMCLCMCTCLLQTALYSESPLKSLSFIQF